MKKQIDNMRKAIGTLPNRKCKIDCTYKNAFESISVKLKEFQKNPYKSIVRMCLATWGSGKIGHSEGSCNKWEKISPENRFIIVLSALKGNTLPIALESINFMFEFNGIPRHTFDQFARARIGTGHASIGCRDNNKLDSPLILYPKLFWMLERDIELKKEFKEWIIKTKKLYSQILDSNKGSWQLARAVLPMSYNHSWVSYMNLLALKGQMARRLMACEESPIVFLFWKMREEIENHFPLIANYLRPACDNARKCIYNGEMKGLTKYFSNLFKGCGRWRTEMDYSEFNHSCSDYQQLFKYIKIINPSAWINYTEDDFYKLDEKDKKLFNED